MKRSAMIAILIAGCGSKAPPVTAPTPTPTPTPAPPPSTAGLTPGIQPDAWLLGDWQSDDGKQHEHWLAAAGALYGVRFAEGGGFVCEMIDDAGDKGALVSWTYADGKASGPTPVADDPKQTGADAMTSGGVAWHRGTGVQAPALVAADHDFFVATRDRGPDGWTGWFAPDGVNWGGGQIVKGHDAIRADIAGLLGKAQLTWAAIDSRMGPSPDLGFTVGTFEVHKDGAVIAKGSYFTVWKQQPDGSWRVVADAGRPEN